MSKPSAADLRLFAAVRTFVAADLARQRRKWPGCRTPDDMAEMSIGMCRHLVNAELSRVTVARLSPQRQRVLTSMP